MAKEAYEYKFDIVFDKEKETTLQKIKRWGEDRKPPFNVIFKYLFSFIEKWYWEGKHIQTEIEIDQQVKYIGKIWDEEDERNRQPTVEEEPSGVPHLPTLRIRAPFVERGPEESGSSMAPPSTQIQIPDPWD
jgi:hypothetical protein